MASLHGHLLSAKTMNIWCWTSDSQKRLCKNLFLVASNKTTQ